VRVLASLVVACALAACSTGGSYVKADSEDGMRDRGETNGRMFDFVSNMPEGDDWQIRIRDNSLWAAYGDGDKVKELGTKPLTKKETNKVWELVEAVDIPGRKKGHEDEDEGWVSLRLREPGGDEGHDIFEILVSRADAEDDQEVLDLAAYLQDLVEKHFKKKPEF
jgi:hypothetical protein